MIVVNGIFDKVRVGKFHREENMSCILSSASKAIASVLANISSGVNDVFHGRNPFCGKQVTYSKGLAPGSGHYAKIQNPAIEMTKKLGTVRKGPEKISPPLSFRFEAGVVEFDEKKSSQSELPKSKGLSQAVNEENETKAPATTSYKWNPSNEQIAAVCGNCKY